MPLLPAPEQQRAWHTATSVPQQVKAVRQAGTHAPPSQRCPPGQSSSSQQPAQPGLMTLPLHPIVLHNVAPAKFAPAQADECRSALVRSALRKSTAKLATAYD